MGKKKKKYEIFVYDDEVSDENLEHVNTADQSLRVRMEKKNRGGKMVTVVLGFQGLGIEALAKKLKTTCGVGGSAKEGEIILQGDVTKKVVEHLKKWGYGDVK